MNRSPVERLLPQLVQMFRAGGMSRWIAVALVVGGIGLVLFRPELISTSTNRNHDRSASQTATTPRNSEQQVDVQRELIEPGSSRADASTAAPGDGGRAPSVTQRNTTQRATQAADESPASQTTGAARATPSTADDVGNRSAAATGELSPGPSGSLRSPAGLVYTRGSQQGHRIRHVMAHARDEPNRPGQHGVFAEDDQTFVVALLDEAYLKSKQGGKDVRRQDEDGRSVVTVNMGRVIGYVGGQSGNRRGKPAANHIRLVLEDNRVITAYPLIP